VAVETIMENAGEERGEDPTFDEIVANLVGDSISVEAAVRAAYLYGWRKEKVISWGDRFFGWLAGVGIQVLEVVFVVGAFALLMTPRRR
jgi:hypothetical protein